MPTLVVGDTHMTKAVCVLYSMKFLYVGGIIKNIPSRYGEIAAKIGISESNLRNKTKVLLAMGLVKREGRNLVFIGFNRISKKYRFRSKKSYRVKHHGPKELETVLKALALENNLQRQLHKIKEKRVKEELKRYGKIQAKCIRKKIERYIRKNISLYASGQNRRVQADSSDTFTYRKKNDTVTLSRMSIASMNGRKSKSTGTRIVKKMNTLGLLEYDQKRVDAVCRCGSDQILRRLDLDSSYFVFKGVLYKRESNIIKLSNFFA